jgi:hypothetical protein
MEKPAVIVTDIQKVATPLAESLFYVAVTRALNKLEVLLEEFAKEEIISAALVKFVLKMPGSHMGHGGKKFLVRKY